MGSETILIHAFEIAGLGKAPFTWKGMIERKYKACHDAPTQPAGSCKYCGTCIMYCHIIESADGKRFEVGSDCVNKTGDEGLRKRVKDFMTEENRKKRAKANEDRRRREAEKASALIAEWVPKLDEPGIGDYFKMQPHPNPPWGVENPTLYSYTQWQLEFGSFGSRVIAARRIEARYKEIHPEQAEA